MNYTVYIKSPRSLFWRKLKRVKADAILENPYKQGFPVRVIVLQDDTRYEIPMTWAIRFSGDRHLSILDKMKKESGGKIQ